MHAHTLSSAAIERTRLAVRRHKGMTLTILDTRRAALALLAKQWGGPTSLSKKLGVTPSYISQMLSGERPITEKSARKFEEKLGLRLGYMSEPHEGDVAIDQSLVLKVIHRVGIALDECKMTLPPTKFADVVTLVYEEAARTGTIDEEFISRILRLMKG